MEAKMETEGSGQGRESGLPWIEKYRPRTLDDLVSQEDIVTTIRKLVDARRLPHLLFYGPPGTGKTSTILAVAREIYGADIRSMVLELNASDSRGIDTVRNEIQTFAATRKLFAKESRHGIKIVILDEADNMTRDAQMALRRVIEKYSRNTRFCLICNYVSKIIPALQSRCTKFRFAPLKPLQIKTRLQHVIEKEAIQITEEAIEAVLQLSQGDMRRVLNLLQSCSLAFNSDRNGEGTKKHISAIDVYAVAGKPTNDDLRTVYQSLLNDDFLMCLEKLETMRGARGIAVEDLISGLFPLICETKLPQRMKCFLLKHMATIEHTLSMATSQKVQLAGFVGTFVLSRQVAQEELQTETKESQHEAERNAENPQMDVDPTG